MAPSPLQLRVPNAILGRMSAVEMAIYTVTEAASGVFGGAAFDVLRLSLRQVVLTLAVASAAMVCLWTGFAAAYGRWAGGRGGAGLGGSKAAAYAPVATEERLEEGV